MAALNFLATTPFYAEIADDLGTSVPLLGQVVTSMILVSAALGIVVGPLADRYGYRWPLTIGVLCVAITLIGTGFAPSYPVLFVLSLIGGLADALVFGLPFAVVGHAYSGAAQRRAMGFAIGSFSVAPIIGIPVLTTIGDLTSWRVALVCAGIGAAATAWFVVTSLPPDEPHVGDRPRLREIVAAYTPLLRHSPTLRLYGVTTLRAVTFIGLLTYLGAFLADEFDIDTRTVGFIYTAGGIGSAAASLLGGRVHFRSPRTVVGALIALNGVTTGIVLLSASIWATVPALMITTGSSALAGVVIATLFVRESPAGTATTMVLNGTLLNVGAAVGAGLGGVLIALGGYSALGIGLPLFAFAAAALALWPANR